MNILNANEWGKLKKSSLESFEKNIGVKLPNDYRRYLLKYNGGIPEQNAILLSEEAGYSGIESLVGLHSEGLSQHGTLKSVMELLSETLPDGMIGIGGDGTGLYFCYFVKGKRKGFIYAIELSELHEMSLDARRREDLSGNGVYYLANTFTNFLEILEEEPD